MRVKLFNWHGEEFVKIAGEGKNSLSADVATEQLTIPCDSSVSPNRAELCGPLSSSAFITLSRASKTASCFYEHGICLPAAKRLQLRVWNLNPVCCLNGLAGSGN
jgi:hypothetical protein